MSVPAQTTPEPGLFGVGAQVAALFEGEHQKHAFTHALMLGASSQGLSPVLTQALAVGVPSYFSQGRTLLGGFSVMENISMPLAHRKLATAQDITRRTRLLCDFGGIDRSLLRRNTDDLQALQRVQACFLQATVGEPDLLVLDTVFEGLTPTDQERVGHLVVGYRRLYPLRRMLYLGYVLPPHHLFRPSSVITHGQL